MTAKEYLRQVERCSCDIRRLEERVAELRIAAMSVSAISNSDKVQSSSNADKMTNMLFRIMQAEGKLNGLKVERELLRVKILEKINLLQDERYVSILYKRYVELKSFEVIATEMGYTWRHTLRIHGNALSDFSKLM